MRYDEYNDANHHSSGPNGHERRYATDHHKSSRRLEEEVRETRAHMDETLDALGDRLEPRRLASDLWHGVTDRLPSGPGGNTGDMIQNASRDIGRRIANHPVPAALVGLGVIWLLSEEATGRSATGEGVAHRGKNAAHSAANASRDAAHRAGAKGRDLTGSAKLQGQKFAGKISSAASDVSDRASDMTSSAAEYVSDAAQRTTHAASTAASRTAEATADAYDSRPLLFGALACAAGLIAGISTPKTRMEKKAFGETGEDIRHRAADFSKEMGKQAGHHMAETAAEAGEKLAQDAEKAAKKAADKVESKSEPKHERSHQTT